MTSEAKHSRTEGVSATALLPGPEMVERVAEALFWAEPWTYNHAPPDTMEDARALARVVLAAAFALKRDAS